MRLLILPILVLFSSSVGLCTSRTFLLEKIIDSDFAVRGHQEVLGQAAITPFKFCRELGKYSESIFGLIAAARDLDVETGAFYKADLSKAEYLRAQLAMEADKLNTYCDAEASVTTADVLGQVSKVEAVRDSLFKTIFQN